MIPLYYSPTLEIENNLSSELHHLLNVFLIDKALRKKRGIMICCVINFQGPEVLKGGSADGKSSKSIVNPCTSLYQISTSNFEFANQVTYDLSNSNCLRIFYFCKKIIIIINNNNK